MDRSSKHLFVTQFQKTLSAASLLVVTQQLGLTVSEMDDLRNQARSCGACLKIPKNTLARLAIQGTPHAPVQPVLTGPTLLAYSADPVAAAKAVCGFAKKNKKLIIQGGTLNGSFLNEAEIKALASLPSLDELRGTFLGLLVAAPSQLVRTLTAPGAQVARVVDAYARKS